MKKSNGIVLVGGCFDLLHFGHISFLTHAKKLGKTLVVALESDSNVRRMKGINRPIHTQEQRKHMLEALSCVDEVILLPPMESDKEYDALVSRISPDVIAITQGDRIAEKKQHQATAIGATLVTLPHSFTPSTSQLTKLLELEV